jgi:hypothetical protein
MTILSAASSQRDPKAAARELAEGLGNDLAFVIFFASSTHDPAALGRALSEVFDAPSIGCTTAGELSPGKMLEGSISAMGFDRSELSSVHVSAIEDPGNPEAVSGAIERLAAAVGAPLSSLDPETQLGLVLQDGMGGSEEAVMMALSNATNVPFVGGSAGDDARFEQTCTFVNFEPHVGGAALALLAPTRPFTILKTQSFDVRDDVLEVTDVDEATRTVRTFNGKPAAEEYARVLGVQPSELPDHWQRHPLGLLMEDGEPFVRSPQQLKGRDVVFYCQVKPGMRLRVLDSRDIVEDTRRDLQRAIADAGGCRAVLNFHCILRTLELKARGQCDAYGRIFDDQVMAGFSTYGESYIGHINQTSTMVIFS